MTSPLPASEKALNLPCRYYRVYTGRGVACREENFQFVERTLPLPLEQTALVLVDLWNTHYIESHLQRANAILEGHIVPLLQAARRAGMLVIHAPSSDVVELRGDTPWPPPPAQMQQYVNETWPPREFRSLYRNGQYSSFGRESEPCLNETLAHYETELYMAPAAQPLPDEPLIVAGQELHEILAKREILHLVYAGFATNWCILLRDYGVIEMSQRGYNVILVRDATTGIEFHDTQETQTATEMAIREIETKHGWSTTSADFVAACQDILEYRANTSSTSP